MADEISIASELYSEISPYKFRRHITCLSKQDYLSPVKFHKSELGQTYWIDIRNVYKNRSINANHLYEYFGQFSDHTGSEVRQILSNLIELNDMFYRSVGFVVLDMHATSYETWVESVGDETAYADELVLYSLCKLYDRHAMVYCHGRNWSTIDPTNPMDTAELHNACNIHLVYLSPGIFGELKRRPFITPNKEFHTAIKINNMQMSHPDSTIPPPINLTKEDSVKPIVSTQSRVGDSNDDKTVESPKPLVEPASPDPPEPEPSNTYQPLVEPISPVHSPIGQESKTLSPMTTRKSVNDAEQLEPSAANSEVTAPLSLYQPLTEPISPVSDGAGEKNDAAAGENLPVLPVDKVMSTTPPGSPPLTPIHEEQQNTDCVDTEEYEDCTSEQNTINGDNSSSDEAAVDKLKSTDNIISINGTSVVKLLVLIMLLLSASRMAKTNLHIKVMM